MLSFWLQWQRNDHYKALAITEEQSATAENKQTNKKKKAGGLNCFKGWGAERPSKDNVLADLRGVSQVTRGGVGWQGPGFCPETVN